MNQLIDSFLTLVHFPPFCKGKISVKIRPSESGKFLFVIILELSAFSERFVSKITRIWSECKGCERDCCDSVGNYLIIRSETVINKCKQKNLHPWKALFCLISIFPKESMRCC